MATNFIKLDSNTSKKTTFTKAIYHTYKIKNAEDCPLNYKNVLHIGYDKYYGDVFKAWDDDENDFVIYFGERGYEFD